MGEVVRGYFPDHLPLPESEDVAFISDASPDKKFEVVQVLDRVAEGTDSQAEKARLTRAAISADLAISLQKGLPRASIERIDNAIDARSANDPGLNRILSGLTEAERMVYEAYIRQEE